MTLTNEYKEMFDRHTKEEDDLAEKYAKHKTGSFVYYNGQKQKILKCFPEQNWTGDVCVKYILSSGEWVFEEDLEK